MNTPPVLLLCKGMYSCIPFKTIFLIPKALTMNRLFHLAVILLGLLAPSTSLIAQNTYTSVQAGDWNDPVTWDDVGIPSPIVKNYSEVFIKHEITLTDSSISIRKGELRVFEGGQLTMNDSDFELRPNGILTLTNGSIYMNNGSVSNNGTVDLSNGYLEIGTGNFTNERILTFDSSCVRLLSGDMLNDVSSEIVARMAILKFKVEVSQIIQHGVLV